MACICFNMQYVLTIGKVNYQLKQSGTNHYWAGMVRIMAMQKAVTSTAINKLGEHVSGLV